MASLRYRIWDRCTRRIPEGTLLPPWAVALNTALFPVRAIGALLYRRTHPFDIWTLSWNLHGKRFSDRALRAMASGLDGCWYKFTRNPNGIVVIDRQMADSALARQGEVEA